MLDISEVLLSLLGFWDFMPLCSTSVTRPLRLLERSYIARKIAQLKHQRYKGLVDDELLVLLQIKLLDDQLMVKCPECLLSGKAEQFEQHFEEKHLDARYIQTCHQLLLRARIQFMAYQEQLQRVRNRLESFPVQFLRSKQYLIPPDMLEAWDQAWVDAADEDASEQQVQRDVSPTALVIWDHLLEQQQQPTAVVEYVEWRNALTEDYLEHLQLVEHIQSRIQHWEDLLARHGIL
jgi:hypothetical protein